MGTHYFYAVKLPNEAKLFLKEWVENIGKTFPFKRWVHPEDYHITLAFLGDAEPRMLDESVQAINNALANEKSFPLTFSNLGTFGKNTQPRIFWAGVENSDALNQIRKIVYNQCVNVGFELDKRPFRPHITLARKWNGELDFQSEQLPPLTKEPFSFNIDEIVLYRTDLQATPKYKEVEVFHLKH